jgi:hypothetical protein
MSLRRACHANARSSLPTADPPVELQSALPPARGSSASRPISVCPVRTCRPARSTVTGAATTSIAIGGLATPPRRLSRAATAGSRGPTRSSDSRGHRRGDAERPGGAGGEIGSAASRWARGTGWRRGETVRSKTTTRQRVVEHSAASRSRPSYTRIGDAVARAAATKVSPRLPPL